MSIESAPSILSSCYERAMNDAPPCERSGIRRAFRAALRALGAGDLRPAVLLEYRWP